MVNRIRPFWLLAVGLLAVLSGAGERAEAQKRDSLDENYRRSSLCVFLIEEAGMPMRDSIRMAFLTSPIPDKYNDHNVVGDRIIDREVYGELTDADRAAFLAAAKAEPVVGEDGTLEVPKKKGGGFGSFMKGMIGLPTLTGSASDLSKDDYGAVAYRYIRENAVAKRLADGWFLEGDSVFSMRRVQERGLYGASAFDIETARNSARGRAMLEDIGEDLIGNTFVLVSRYRYMSKDELAAEIDAIAQAAAELAGGGYASLAASAATLAVKASLGAGDYVKSTAYLFKLRWNPEVAGRLYGELWGDREAYDNSDLFSLRYIGSESAWANVKAGIFTDKSEAELIRIATINASDATIAKLAKKNDVFKTKTPLIVDEEGGIYARIGLKEGLEAGDRFEVLERVWDEKKGRTVYVKRGEVKVAKDQIWDNRYMADEELKLTGREQGFDRTRFVGSARGLYSGMLLRQIK